MVKHLAKVCPAVNWKVKSYLTLGKRWKTNYYYCLIRLAKDYKKYIFGEESMSL